MTPETEKRLTYLETQVSDDERVKKYLNGRARHLTIRRKDPASLSIRRDAVLGQACRLILRAIST